MLVLRVVALPLGLQSGLLMVRESERRLEWVKEMAKALGLRKD